MEKHTSQPYNPDIANALFRSNPNKKNAKELPSHRAKTVVNMGRPTLTEKKQRRNKSTYPKDGVSFSKDSFVVNESFVFQSKFCGESPAIRVAANR